tara:strand:+ start:775 stop:1197 length:423 start_codon:yes stop_codon:yes gene_type:complete
MKAYTIALSNEDSPQGYQQYDIFLKPNKILWTGPRKPLVKYLAKLLKSTTNAKHIISYIEKNGSAKFKFDKFKGSKIKENAFKGDPDKMRLSMLKIYGSSLVQNYKTILVKLDRGKAIKKDYKAFKGIINLIDKKLEEVL